jgi:hypothetical protein
MPIPRGERQMVAGGLPRGAVTVLEGGERLEVSQGLVRSASLVGLWVDDRRPSFDGRLARKLDGLAPGIGRVAEARSRALHDGGPRTKARDIATVQHHAARPSRNPRTLATASSKKPSPTAPTRSICPPCSAWTPRPRFGTPRTPGSSSRQRSRMIHTTDRLSLPSRGPGSNRRESNGYDRPASPRSTWARSTASSARPTASTNRHTTPAAPSHQSRSGVNPLDFPPVLPGPLEAP